MNTYKEREAEAYKLVLDKLGIEMLRFDKQVILSVGEGTDEDKRDLIICILVLQAKFFELALRLDTGVNDNKNTRLMNSKKIYSQTINVLDEIYNRHAELLVDDKVTTHKIKESKPS